MRQHARHVADAARQATTDLDHLVELYHEQQLLIRITLQEPAGQPLARYAITCLASLRGALVIFLPTRAGVERRPPNVVGVLVQTVSLCDVDYLGQVLHSCAKRGSDQRIFAAISRRVALVRSVPRIMCRSLHLQPTFTSAVKNSRR